MKIRLALISFMIMFSSSILASVNIKPFIGYWTVSMDQTMKEIKKSPKYSPGEIEKMPAIINSLMKKMKLEISKDQLTYIRGSKRKTVKLEVTGGSNTSITATSNVEGKNYTLTFTLLDGKYLNFRSSGSDDMDYFIWEKAN